MKDLFKYAIGLFESYVNSFPDLSGMHKKNFRIKKNHCIRVADNSLILGKSLTYDEDEINAMYIAGLFHDIGRFDQLFRYNTFNDEISLDHADHSVKILTEKRLFDFLEPEKRNLILRSVQLHNKFKVPGSLSGRELLHVRALRDADKLDILKVLTDYYLLRNGKPNHTLTWGMPAGIKVSPDVSNDILEGKLISKNKVKSEIDIKILQLSWVYDLNF